MNSKYKQKFKFSINSLYLLIFTVSYIIVAYLKVPFLMYIISMLFAIKYFKLTKKKIIYYYMPLFIIIGIITYGNFEINHNYIDLIVKGAVKLLYFVLMIDIMVCFFYNIFLNNFSQLRYAMYVLILFGLIFEQGINIQNSSQILSIYLFFLVEFLQYLYYKQKVSFFVSLFLIFFTTKKQLILGMLITIFSFKKHYIIKLIPFIVVIIFFILLFGGVTKEGDSDTTTKRVEKTFTTDFFVPSLYTNPRLYLFLLTIPKVYEDNKWFGYGMLRYGDVDAYRTNRDIERKIGMDDFLPIEFNSSSRFDSIAADVSLVTIAMQMGIYGVLFFALIIILTAKYFKISQFKLFIILMPVVLSGPILTSVLFPAYIGMVVSALRLIKYRSII